MEYKKGELNKKYKFEFIFIYELLSRVNKIYIIYLNLLIDFTMGIGDWGLGIGPNPQSPIPNTPTPTPQPPSF